MSYRIPMIPYDDAQNLLTSKAESLWFFLNIGNSPLARYNLADLRKSQCRHPVDGHIHPPFFSNFTSLSLIVHSKSRVYYALFFLDA